MPPVRQMVALDRVLSESARWCEIDSGPDSRSPRPLHGPSPETAELTKRPSPRRSAERSPGARRSSCQDSAIRTLPLVRAILAGRDRYEASRELIEESHSTGWHRVAPPLVWCFCQLAPGRPRRRQNDLWRQNGESRGRQRNYRDQSDCLNLFYSNIL